jgi:hypothetical protein
MFSGFIHSFPQLFPQDRRQCEEMTERFSASEQVEGVPPGGTLAIAISGIHPLCPKNFGGKFYGLAGIMTALLTYRVVGR